MLRRALLALVLTAGLGKLSAQDVPYRVVFDLTSRDSLDQRAVMRWIKEITSAHPDAKLEVVMYGKGFELVMPERSAYLADVQTAMKNPNVEFKVCQVAMKSNGIEKSMILPATQTVPDGIYEILMKQRDGWGYIKVAH